MAVTIKKSNTHEISATGRFVEINETGIVVDDVKTGRDTLSFELLKEFLNKDVSIKIKTKDEEVE